MGTVGIVLAAGASRRFGSENKLLAQFRDGPLAGSAARAMSDLSLAHRIVVVANARVGALFTEIDARFDVVTLNAPDVQSASLAAGVARARALAAERVLITLADMPLVTADDLRGVLAISAPVTATTDGDTVMPPACFDRKYFDQLAQIQGDRGAGKLLKTLPNDALFSVPSLRLSDVDTTQDLSHIRPN